MSSPSPGDGEAGPAREALLTPSFVFVTAAAFAYFVAVGTVLPVLPPFVKSLGGGGLGVGAAVGAFGVSAAAARPLVGRYADRHGRRRLVVGGCLLATAANLSLTLVGAPLLVVLVRLASGVGEGALVVGTATAIQDMAPDHRRAEAASYFSVAIYGGLALGPTVGELALEAAGFDAVWVIAALLCVTGALLGTRAPGGSPSTTPVTLGRLLHPDGLVPGMVLGLSLTGLVAFQTFLPFYVREIGLSGARTVLLVYAALILIVRIVGARIPDRLGHHAVVSAGLVVMACGQLMIFGWRGVPGLYLGAALFGLGNSLLFPALMAIVVTAAPAAERSSAVGTFTLFFDFFQGFTAPMLGVIVALSGSEAAPFAVAALAAMVALGLFRTAVVRAPGAAPAST